MADTRTVTGTILHPVSGGPWAYAYVAFTLQDLFVTADATLPPEQTSVITDASGDFSVNLAVPDSGSTTYDVLLPDGDSHSFSIEAGAATTLEALLLTESVTGAISTLAGGSDGQVLTVDTSAGTGLAWTDPTVINVKDSPYSATGDGVTDDESAVQAAITAAAGGIVFFPEGTYLIGDGALTYGSNTILRGAGGGSVIKNGSSKITSNRILEPADATVANVLIEGLTFDQNFAGLGWDTDSPAISVDYTVDVTIQNCIFRDIITIAVWCDSDAATGSTERLTLRGNRVEGSEAGGFSLFGSLVDCVISGNLITDCQEDPIAVQEGTANDQPDGITITGNVCRDNNLRNTTDSTPHGILVYGALNATVSGNVVDGTVASGIMVSAGTTLRSENVAVVGNVVHDAGVTADDATGVPRNGIYIYNSDRVTVAGNAVTDSVHAGVYVNGCTQVTVAGNNCSVNAMSGINLHDVTDGVVSGNMCMDNGSSNSEPYGLLLSSTDGTDFCSNIVVIGNRAGDSGGGTQDYGLYISGSDTTAVSVHGNDLNGNAVADMGGVAGTGTLFGVTSSAAAPATTPGSVAKKLEVFDASGASLGFVALYDGIS